MRFKLVIVWLLKLLHFKKKTISILNFKLLNEIQGHNLYKIILKCIHAW
jgi:hypothetical protein